ncbi:MAG: adenylate/guanylate cyclase domain-containing protein [Pseudomonadota bacterium]
MRVRLQIGVATSFTLLTALLLGIVVAFLYFGNRDLALRTAESDMAQARAQSVDGMLASIRATGRAVTSAASFVGEFPEEARSLAGLDVLHALARGNDHYYGLYFGLGEDGAFYQNVLLSDEITSFGPSDTPVPEWATRVLRIIDGPPEARTETYYWSNEDGTVEPFHIGTPTYDPRERPWFTGGVETENLYITQLYRFESTGRPGVTFAQRIEDGSGRVIGVAGIDMTLSALSGILEDLRVGAHGLVFMLDDDGRLMSYTGSRAGGEGARFVTSTDAQDVEIQSTVIEGAVSQYRDDGDAFFRFTTPTAEDAGPEVHIASVAPIPRIFGAEPTLGLTVPEDEFVGDIKRTTARALQISGLVLIVAIASTLVVARLLGASLRLVADEARRISNFELGEDLNLRSAIQEVSDLETAMTSMKAGLSSFGAYVPKDLVRSIVSSGEQIGVGGTSREVTLLFSDLQGFTASTESLEPEDLMPALSQYFEVMETRIAETGGTVDKYIGDAIMAMWNAPLDDPKHVENGCRAVLACLRAEDQLNSGTEDSPLLPLRTRFGLHTGRVIVGNVGSLSRMQYTALGAVVNLASRLESLNKQYGTRVLVSEAVAEITSSQFLFREVDVVSPVGTSKPVKILELMGDANDGGTFPVSPETRAEVAAWDACYALYRAQSWQAALDALTAHRASAASTALIDTYIDRCQSFITSPPPPDWDGVFSFKVK